MYINFIFFSLHMAGPGYFFKIKNNEYEIDSTYKFKR